MRSLKVTRAALLAFIAMTTPVVLAGCRHAGPRDDVAAAPSIPATTIASVEAMSTSPRQSAPAIVAGPSRRPATPIQRTSTRQPAVNRENGDPLAVAQAYVAARHLYRWDDPAGYARAVTAAAFSTEAFAARSHPDASALDRLRTAQESSTVRVGAAQVDGEAPNSATVRYVNVAFVSTVTYRGDGSGRPRPEVWDLRLVRTRAGRWRVDGVPSTS